MTTRALLVALMVAAVALPVGAVSGAPAAGPDGSQPTLQLQSQANASSNASFGTSVASFMQASTAEADGEVGQGMFLAHFNRSNASERPQVLDHRVSELRDRIETLRAQRAALLNDSNVTAADRARAARLSARIDALQASINGTERAGERAGLDVEALAVLREDAQNLSGQEIAEIATGLAGGGPPEDRGEGQGQPSDDGQADAGGPADDPGAEGNESDAGNDGDRSDGQPGG